jgi:hypothetical protein
MSCEREDELLHALERGYIGAELDAHVSGCGPCSELRLVAGALLEDRAAVLAEAPLPSAGTLWWRMRLRHRQEAMSRARRTLVIGQAATLVAALGLLMAFFGTDITTAVRHFVATVNLRNPLLLVAATCLLGAPIAGWLVVRQK